MIDKDKVKNSFRKNLKTYDKNALVQREMAQTLIRLLPEKKYGKVFEIGMGTGFLTREIILKLQYDSMDANDIVQDCQFVLRNLTNKANFLCGDIETLDIQGKYDLVVSNAVLQWCSDFEQIVLKLYDILNEGGVFAFTSFGENNFKEIKDVFGTGLRYVDYSSLTSILGKYFEIEYSKSEERELFFPSFKEILSHIKKTGVNAVSKDVLKVSELKHFEKDYIKKYSTSKGLSLTYHPVYFVLKKLRQTP